MKYSTAVSIFFLLSFSCVGTAFSGDSGSPGKQPLAPQMAAKPMPQLKINRETQQAIAAPGISQPGPSGVQKGLTEAVRPRVPAPTPSSRAPKPESLPGDLPSPARQHIGGPIWETATIPSAPVPPPDTRAPAPKVSPGGGQHPIPRDMPVISDSISRDTINHQRPPEAALSPEMAEQIRELEKLRAVDENRAALIPELQASAPDGGGTGLDNPDRIGVDPNRPSAAEMVRDLTLGRGGPFNADPSNYIGADTDRGPNLTKYGTGSARSTMDAPGDPGHASTADTVISRQSTNSDGARTDKVVVDHGDGTRSLEITESYTTADDTTATRSSLTTYKVSSGEIISQTTSTAEFDIHGNQINRNFATSVPPQNRPKISGPGSDSQPNETTPSGEFGDENPVTGWNSPKGKKDPMEMISQPVHGDDVSSLQSGQSETSKLGTSVVTNPDEHHEGRGGGGSGGEPGEGTVDPEEIIPGGPLPTPGGSMAAENLDARMGLLEIPSAQKE